MSEDQPYPLQNISIILVGTLQAGNIGSVARAMKNMGLSRLKLVNPVEIVNTECIKMAGKALDLVHSAEVFDDFDAAIASEDVLIATTSARGREPERQLTSPRELAERIVGWTVSRQVGLVFGPERSGLNSSQLSKCQYWVSVQGNPDYPVLNLAQSVMILAYEIFSAGAPAKTLEGDSVSQQEREQMFAQMEEVLVEIGFLSSGSPQHIMQTLRGVFGHSELNPRELQILRGILSQISWYVNEGYKLGPEAVRKP